MPTNQNNSLTTKTKKEKLPFSFIIFTFSCQLNLTRTNIHDDFD